LPTCIKLACQSDQLHALWGYEPQRPLGFVHTHTEVIGFLPFYRAHCQKLSIRQAIPMMHWSSQFWGYEADISIGSDRSRLLQGPTYAWSPSCQHCGPISYSDMRCKPMNTLEPDISIMIPVHFCARRCVSCYEPLYQYQYLPRPGI
jgi:hypothetical protein